MKHVSVTPHVTEYSFYKDINKTKIKFKKPLFLIRCLQKLFKW